MSRLRRITNDDATARVRDLRTDRYAFTPSQAPGTVLGPVDRPLEGSSTWLVPTCRSTASSSSRLRARSPRRCSWMHRGRTPLASWFMVSACRQDSVSSPDIPCADIRTAGGARPRVHRRLPSPARRSSRDTGPHDVRREGLQREVHDQGRLHPGAARCLDRVLTPYNPGNGTVNAAGTVASPAAMAPGALAFGAKSPVGERRHRRVTQAGQPRAGASVTIVGGATKAKLRRPKKCPCGRDREVHGQVRCRDVLPCNGRRDSRGLRAAVHEVSAALAPIPCVNPTVNGFTAKSKVVKKK